MEERVNECEEMDEVMLPGFRFHPTDEELVGFYLRRKILHKPLSIELIKQLDIYKYDPWDLPKFASTGEKEWYFYCPRDRKYRNSPRPNRVTGAGFWKATGTDRPIYASDGGSPKTCIGLKKSLVFYKGRAAKGIKTDWMMHEFRLPSNSNSLSAKRYLDKNIPANEAWAICRIFKKASSSAQRALSHTWIPPILDIAPTIINPNLTDSSHHFTSMGSKITSSVSPQYGFHNDPCPALTNSNSNSSQYHQQTLPGNPTVSPTVTSEPKHATINDASSLLLDMSNSVLGDSGKGTEDSMDGYGFSMSNTIQGLQDLVQIDEDPMMRPVVGFHYGLGDAWKWNLAWDSSTCPAEFTNNCYT